MRHLITVDQHMHARGMTSLFATEFMDFTGRTNDPLRTFRMSIIFCVSRPHQDSVSHIGSMILSTSAALAKTN